MYVFQLQPTSATLEQRRKFVLEAQKRKKEELKAKGVGNTTTSGANATTRGTNATASGANATTSGANATTSGANPTTSGANATTTNSTVTAAISTVQVLTCNFHLYIVYTCIYMYILYFYVIAHNYGIVYHMYIHQRVFQDPRKNPKSTASSFNSVLTVTRKKRAEKKASLSPRRVPSTRSSLSPGTEI